MIEHYCIVWSTYVLCSLNDTHITLSYNYRTPSKGPATRYPIAGIPTWALV